MNLKFRVQEDLFQSFIQRSKIMFNRSDICKYIYINNFN
jgi:hypothetical protein